MRLHYQLHFIILTILTLSGCINTNNIQQQEKITSLEKSLKQANTTINKTQSQLNDASTTIKIHNSKISNLSSALKKSNKALQNNITTAQSNVSHLKNKTVIGETEWVYISKVKQNFKARIDTGAATSSINAVNIQHFERDGKKWIRFNTSHSEDEVDDLIEAKVVRTARIRQSSFEEESKRPVIELYVRIGDIAHLTEFSLTDRQKMEFPVLIGRNFLRDVILVDVAKKFNTPKYSIIDNSNK